MNKRKKRKVPEIVENDRDPPLQEITPNNEEEQKKRDQEAVIRQKILDEMNEEDRDKRGQKPITINKPINKARGEKKWL